MRPSALAVTRSCRTSWPGENTRKRSPAEPATERPRPTSKIRTKSPSPTFRRKDARAATPEWTAEQAEYQVDAVQNYIRGKMRKAEFWLAELIGSFQRAKDTGVPETVLAEARKYHDTAHILWEWWTAENSDGFHNPEQARQSLAESVAASQKGIEILNKAISQKVAPKWMACISLRFLPAKGERSFAFPVPQPLSRPT